MSGRALVLPLLLVLPACNAAAPSIPHDDEDLPLHSSERVRLRSDLPADDAEAFLARVEALELAVDSAYPWLEAPSSAPLTLVLADAARFSLMARDHAAPERSGAFVCREGELVFRYRPELWAEHELGAPVATEPKVRPLAASVVRRRLLELGRGVAGESVDVQATWLEEGLVAVYVELAAGEVGEARTTVRRNRERLLDAYLPLYLGGRPSLVRVCDARGRDEMKRVGSTALAWAAVRYLLSDAELTPLLALAVRDAAGEEEAEEPWKQALEALAAKEGDFERFLLAATLRELLVGFRDGATAVDRWECADALRLIANLDLDSDADDATRAEQFTGSEALLTESPPLPRFFDKYERELRQVYASRSRLETLARLRGRIRKEFARRSKGYGHAAVEFARKDLGRALQRALERVRP